jgi:hypothetical protein
LQPCAFDVAAQRVVAGTFYDLFQERDPGFLATRRNDWGLPPKNIQLMAKNSILGS